jgi:hypothetical protein
MTIFFVQKNILLRDLPHLAYSHPANDHGNSRHQKETAYQFRTDLHFTQHASLSFIKM